MEISYLSWLRTRIGKSAETLAVPEGVSTLDELVDWLIKKEDAYHALSAHRSIINASVNGDIVSDWAGCTVKNGDKITFFSPLAGG